MKPLHTCRDCARVDKRTQLCPIFNQQVDFTKDRCPQFLFPDQIYTCAVCKSQTANPIISVKKSDYITFLCANCYEHMGECSTCKKANTCSFETDPSQLPKYIQKTIQQGNMQTITQIKNPERIKITCEKGCKCYSKEFGCLKANGTCGNYTFIAD